MEDYAEMAVDFMRSGFHCSESVIRATAARYGFDPGYSRVATALGGGISNCGDLCGILTGGLISIGIIFGRASEQDLKSDGRCKALGKSYYRWFMDNFGRCSDIIGYPPLPPYDDCHRVLRKSVERLHAMIDEEKERGLKEYYKKA
jgi:C_GCAxxG_C_C family probable redox protein